MVVGGNVELSILNFYGLNHIYLANKVYSL